MSLLEVTGLNSYYRESHILFDVSLRVEMHETVALLGRNGAGKSTTLKSLMGVVTPRAGSVKLDGVELVGRKAHSIARLGMQLVHEERRIFGSLSVEENIILAGLTAESKWPLAASTRCFPRSRSGARAAALTFPAASNKCSRLRARSSALRRSSCLMSRSRGLRRLSSRISCTSAAS